MFQGVIFDMDGVIIDSEPLHAQAGVMALDKFGVTVPVSYCYNFIGSTTRHMFQTAINEFELSVTVDELDQASACFKEQLLKEQGYIPIPGVISFIKDLYEHGVLLAIASSSTLEDIEKVVTALDIKKYFTKIISGSRLPHPKPAPDVFLKALDELQISPMNGIVIEDSTNGTLAAYAAGIPTIGFLNKNSGNQNLSKAQVLIESFDSIDYDFIKNVSLRANGLPLTITSTNRLTIRELSLHDIPALYEIVQHPLIRKTTSIMTDPLPTEIEKHKAYIQEVYGFYGYGLWGVFRKEDEQLIGQCGIQNQTIDGTMEMELSYLLAPSVWKQGYALEATKAILSYCRDQLELKRVIALIAPSNTSSLKVAKNLGMTFQKPLRHHNKPFHLYSKNLTPPFSKEEKYETATKKVWDRFQKHPDTNVYSKRYL